MKWKIQKKVATLHKYLNISFRCIINLKVCRGLQANSGIWPTKEDTIGRVFWK